MCARERALALDVLLFSYSLDLRYSIAMFMWLCSYYFLSPTVTKKRWFFFGWMVLVCLHARCTVCKCACVFIATGTKSGQISMPNSDCQTQETYLIYSLAAVNVQFNAEFAVRWSWIRSIVHIWKIWCQSEETSCCGCLINNFQQLTAY